MPSAWRLTKTKYLASTWDGEGARRTGGRWNSAGVRVVYTSATLSLALLEVLVNLQDAGILPAYSAIRTEFEDALVAEVDPAQLPEDWTRYPAPETTKAIGDRWIADAPSAILRVPSVVVPGEYNYLMNPEHRDFNLVRMDAPTPFPFDPRLVDRS
jgi:RES domain-containing protein